MDKQTTKVADINNDFFGGMSVESSQFAKLLGPGQHRVVNVPDKGCAIIMSNGTDTFQDRVRQLELTIESTDTGARMKVFLTLDAHKRYPELTEADIAGIKGAAFKMPEPQWNKLSLEDKIANVFEAVQNIEGENIAVSKINAPAYGSRPALIEGHRLLDPVRSTNIRKKTMSMVAVAGILEEGTTSPKMSDIITNLNTNVYEFGVQVSAGIVNTKGKSMPRIDFFLAAADVEVSA
jgi:hypothetical protein